MSNIGFAIIIILSQILGAATGCAFVWLSNVHSGAPIELQAAINAGAGLADKDGSKYLPMFITETWVTFVFLSVIMGVKYHSAAKDLQLNCFMIGLTLSCNILISANTTGASLNPAVGLVLPIFSKICDKTKYDGLKYIWVWTLGPALGGTLAALQNKWNCGVQKRMKEFNDL